MPTNDRRTDPTRPWAFVVFTDSFMSGWGQAPRRSLYALAVSGPQEYRAVMAQGARRSDMKRGRLVGVKADGTPKVRLGRGDHLSITDRTEAPRWYSTDPADAFNG